MMNGKEREESPRDREMRRGEGGEDEVGSGAQRGRGEQQRGTPAPADPRAGWNPAPWYASDLPLRQAPGDSQPAAGPARTTPQNQGFGGVGPDRSQPEPARLSSFARRFQHAPSGLSEGFGRQVSPPRQQTRGRRPSSPLSQHNRGRQASEPRSQQDRGRRPSLPRTPATKTSGSSSRALNEDERQQLLGLYELHTRKVAESTRRKMCIEMLRKMVASGPYRGGGASNVDEPPRSDPGRQDDVMSPPEDIETDAQTGKKAAMQQRRNAAADAYVKSDPPERCTGPARKRFLKAERARKQAYLDKLQAQWDAEYDLEAGRTQGDNWQGAGNDGMDLELENPVDPGLTVGNLVNLAGGQHTGASRPASVTSIQLQVVDGNDAFTASDRQADVGESAANPGIDHAVPQRVGDLSAEQSSDEAALAEAVAVPL